MSLQCNLPTHCILHVSAEDHSYVGTILSCLLQLGAVVTVGANVSFTNLLELFENNTDDPTLPYFAPFARHMKLVATQSVRNVS